MSDRTAPHDAHHYTANGHAPPGDWPFPDVPPGDAYEGNYPPRDAPQRGKKAPPVTFDLMDSETFATKEFPREWLVSGLLVRGQPAVVGGPKKALKTTLLVELALSLGSGTPFLGHFPTKPCRVALLSGESGMPTLQETARRICATKDINLRFADVLWCDRLPQFASPDHVEALCSALKAKGVEVVIVDPLYLALLAGADAAGLHAANLYDIGPLLMTFAQACLDIGVTPILAHHFKARPNNYDEPQLDDLAFSGIGEFSRQWVLVGRREKFEPGTGQHKLWLSSGGSSGHSGLWALDVDEGVIRDDFTGRRWGVEVTAGAAFRRDTRGAKAEAKRTEKEKQNQADEATVMRIVARLCKPSPEGCGFTQTREATGLSPTRFGRAVNALIEAGALEELPVVRQLGSGAKRPCRGLRPATSGPSVTIGLTDGLTDG